MGREPYGSGPPRQEPIAPLFEELADVDWRHPAWRGLAAGLALLERVARNGSPDDDLYAEFLAANGGPRSDTFMARPRPAGGDPFARAAGRVRAAQAALAALDGDLPGQPLRCALRWDGGWLRRAPLRGPARVALVTSEGAFLAPVDQLDDRVRIDPEDPAPTPAAIAVAVAPESLDTARHLHRRAWTRGGGPWLGLGETGELELVTTCHLAIDGYGHALLADRIFARPPERGPDRPLAPLPWQVPGGLPLGFAGGSASGPRLDLARAAYAFGRALERVYPTGRAHGPTFQVAVAPGLAGDPTRRRRRVLFGLLALRRAESLPQFQARLPGFVAREAAARGPLSRLLAATIHAPLPAAVRLQLLNGAGRPHRWVPPIETLGGRGGLSWLRFDPEPAPAAPLYAASSPALEAAPGDSRGAVVLTLVHHAGGFTASLCGNGLAGTAAGAQRVLETWLEALSAVGYSPAQWTSGAVAPRASGPRS